MDFLVLKWRLMVSEEASMDSPPNLGRQLVIMMSWINHVMGAGHHVVMDKPGLIARLSQLHDARFIMCGHFLGSLGLFNLGKSSFISFLSSNYSWVEN